MNFGWRVRLASDERMIVGSSEGRRSQPTTGVAVDARVVDEERPGRPFSYAA